MVGCPKVQLCFARVEKTDAGYSVLGLFPVSISRVLYEAAPQDLVDESLLDAYWIDRLSPADRVFGWVRRPDRRREKVRPQQELSRIVRDTRRPPGLRQEVEAIGAALVGKHEDQIILLKRKRGGGSSGRCRM